MTSKYFKDLVHIHNIVRIKKGINICDFNILLLSLH